MLTRAEKPEFDHPSSILYFAVPDIQAAYGKMKESGVHFEEEPHLIARMPAHDLWMTFFRDTEGNLMALMSEVTRYGRCRGCHSHSVRLPWPLFDCQVSDG